MTDCKHEKTVTLSLGGSLWGPFGAFCRECGACTSDPEIEARPEAVRQVREMDERFAEANARWEALSPEEKEQRQKDLAKGIAERREKLAEQLKPFQQPHNCLRRCDCGRNRRLD